MKKILYTIPALLLIGGVTVFMFNDRQDAKTRALPQVEARNNSITPSENYVHSVIRDGRQIGDAQIFKLPSDEIIYIYDPNPDEKSTTYHLNIYQKEQKSFNVVVVKPASKKCEFKIKSRDDIWFVVSYDTSYFLDVTSDEQNVYWLRENEQAQNQTSDELLVDVYEFRFDNQGFYVIDKVSDQEIIDTLYANAMSANTQGYNKYFSLDKDEAGFYVHGIQLTAFGEAVGANRTELQLFPPGMCIIRIVEGYITGHGDITDDQSEINLTTSVQCEGNVHFTVHNDSEHLIRINGVSIPVGSKTNIYASDAETTVEPPSITIEKLNVEDGDRIYVTGITQEYIKKMNAVGDMFAFKIDWEVGVNKSFDIHIAPTSNRDIPIRMPDGSISTFDAGHKYHVTITWSGNTSSIVIDDITTPQGM